eukprot:GHUV01023648.1.p1 GENE.GHUV01023648.1~~GHUV01023648.1.p1  ORF type:complete len:120 (-),score=16.96 GHUV01023648.1:736-1095(-)
MHGRPQFQQRLLSGILRNYHRRLVSILTATQTLTCAGSPCYLVLQELCLPYEVSASDLDEADPSNLLMLVTYLFTALPQLLPRATLEFTCKLAEQQVTRRSLYRFIIDPSRYDHSRVYW